MKIAVTEEDKTLIPLIVASWIVAGVVAVYAVHVHRTETKKRQKIREDRDAHMAAHEDRMADVKTFLDAAAQKQRDHLDSILKPLREQGLID